MIYPKSDNGQVLSCIRKKANDEAKFLLQKVEGPYNFADSLGLTLLHHSVISCNATMVQHLIEVGCNINAGDNSCPTPLILSIENTNLGVFRYMDVVNEDLKIVEILLKNNADIYHANRDGMNSLQLAVRNRLDKPPVVDLKQNTHVIFEMFLDRINKDFLTKKPTTTALLLNANAMVKLVIVASGSVELAKLMLENGYPIVYQEPERSLTALHWAIIMGKRENAKMLIEHGANIDSVDECSPLYYYTDNFEHVDEQSQVLKTLIEVGWTVLRDRTTVKREMERLLVRGNKETVRTVLQATIDAATMNFSSGRSLLHLLIDNENIEVLDLFAELNITFNVNALSDAGTALITSIRHGRLKKVEYLLKYGAGVNLTLSGHESVLFCACKGILVAQEGSRSTVKIVELLLQHGAYAQFVLRRGVYHRQSILDWIHQASGREILMKVIVAHLALLGALDHSPLNDSIRKSISSRPSSKNYFVLCTKQLKEMRNIQVYKAVTLFELFAEGLEKLVTYARKQDFIVAFNDTIRSTHQFEPYYLNTLQHRITQALDKIELDKKAAEVIDLLTGLCKDVHYFVVYKIINFLSIQDLYNLCHAARISSWI